MTLSDETGLITHNKKYNFLTHTQSYVSALARFQCQIWPLITDLFLLLAAFYWPAGDPYKQSGIFMVPWVAISELCLSVKYRGAGWC